MIRLGLHNRRNDKFSKQSMPLLYNATSISTEYLCFKLVGLKIYLPDHLKTGSKNKQKTFFFLLLSPYIRSKSFGLFSLFNGISTFVGYLMPMSSLQNSKQFSLLTTTLRRHRLLCSCFLRFGLVV